jgi:hypothetical protein
MPKTRYVYGSGSNRISEKSGYGATRAERWDEGYMKSAAKGLVKRNIKAATKRSPKRSSK